MLKKVRNKLRVKIGKERYKDMKRLEKTERQRDDG